MTIKRDDEGRGTVYREIVYYFLRIVFLIVASV